MNLVDWTNLSEKERHDLLRVWSGSREAKEVYFELATEAASALLKQVSEIPGITNVEVGGGEVISANPSSPFVEAVLRVCTTFPESHHIPEVPTQYCGFRVTQWNLGDKREAYLQTWTKIFSELTGWDPQKSLQVAQKWEDALTGRVSTAIYHYTPLVTILGTLVGEEAKKAVGHRLSDLYFDIRAVIEHPGGRTRRASNILTK